VNNNLKNILNLEFEKAYKQLNPEQKQAVDTIEGPVMVIAGPGSGKTQLLALRVANILKLTDTRPQNILCLTFTDLAAKNMRDRLTRYIGSEANKVKISTYHSFALDQMALSPEKFGGGIQLKVIDDYNKAKLFEKVLSGVKKANYYNQLASYYQNHGFVYQNDVIKKISELKNNGVSAQDFKLIIERTEKELEFLTPILGAFLSPRVNKEMYEEIPQIIQILINKLQEIAKNDDLNFKGLGQVSSLTKLIVDDLARTNNQYSQDPDVVKNKPLTEFKGKYWATGSLKDADKIPKLNSLYEIYLAYEKEMSEQGLIDFSDMVNLLSRKMQNDNDLSLKIQSQYEYILVDEFQDTSLSQLTLISNLLNMEVTNGEPNILVVGDDDQSIYKFQGAQIENLTKFIEYFPKPPTLITLNKNYRSVSSIVDLANQVISESETRFSTNFGLNKEVIATKQVVDENSVESIEAQVYSNQAEELVGIGTKVQELLKQGIEPKEIAVITKAHADLEKVARQLQFQNIPVTYERGQNILDKPHIVELLKLAELVKEMIKTGDLKAWLMVDVLCSEYWSNNFSTIDVYKLSVLRNKTKEGWIELMLKDPKFEKIATWLLEVSRISQNTSAERVLDILIGQNHEQNETDFSETKNFKNNWINEFSPFAHFYYSFDKLNIEYLSTLSALKTLISNIRKYQTSKQGFITITELLEFFEFHKDQEIRMVDSNVFNQNANAVNLLTVHKAKGLEYEHVFITSLNYKKWFKKGMSSKISFTGNMPFAVMPDELDDKLRVLYVSLTRAKSNLHLSSHNLDDSGKIQEKISYLSTITFTDTTVDRKLLSEAVLRDIFNRSKDKGKVTDQELKEILQPLIYNYKLSVTHLWNFLDLENKGPKYFLENNLLRFPCAKNSSAAYGTSVHAVLHQFYCRYKVGVIISLEEVLELYVISLKEANLIPEEYEEYLRKGNNVLSEYYKKSLTKIGDDNSKDIDFRTEVPFSQDEILLGEARITGQLDKLEIRKPYIKVVDYKTGKPLDKFSTSGGDLAKSENYKTQLLYYKILLENSVEYGLSSGLKVGALALDFVESRENNTELNLTYTNEELEEVKQLIQVVYKKIINLDFEVPKEIIDLPEKYQNKAWKDWLLKLV
jgi:DNA helicase II / ATP-dependent DNA helicase PcrA